MTVLGVVRSHPAPVAPSRQPTHIAEPHETLGQGA
jgi:hypothetical protein